MLEPWNDLSILPPPINTSPSIKKIDIKGLKNACNNIVRVLSKQSPLHKESALVSRFLYKFDKKFRNDMGYRLFKKVNTALRKYLTLPVIKEVQSFIDIIPTTDEHPCYLPTRQMLEYVMVRIMTFSKLMLRITVCSKQAAVFYLNRVKHGESHWMCLMPYALLSRVWSMGLVLLQHSCNWYNKLYTFLEYLQIKGVNFLPENYQLPNDLDKWIGMKNLNEIGRFEWCQKLKYNIDSVMLEDEDGELCETILKYVNKVNEDNNNLDELQRMLPKQKEICSFSNNNFEKDEGVAICRESFNQINSIEKVNKSHSIEIVKDKVSLNEFVNIEERYRIESDSRSITNHLSFMQWHTLKSALLKLDNTLINNKKIEKKVKKIWQEKCLDYS